MANLLLQTIRFEVERMNSGRRAPFISNKLLARACALLAILALTWVPAVAHALQRQYAPTAAGLRLGAGGVSIYKAGWIDLNKNGQKDIYEDPVQPVEKRVEDLFSKMTPAERLAQLYPEEECSSREERNELQRVAIEKSRLGIPLAFGIWPAQNQMVRCSMGRSLGSSSDLASGNLEKSVRQVLRAKFIRGLFEQPYTRGGRPSGPAVTPIWLRLI